MRSKSSPLLLNAFQRNVKSTDYPSQSVSKTKSFDCVHTLHVENIYLVQNPTKDDTRSEEDAIEMLRNWFRMVTGVRQDCILSPLLCAVVNEWVLNLATRDNKRIVSVDEAGLESADDIAALSSSTQTTSVFWSQSADTPRGMVVSP